MCNRTSWPLPPFSLTRVFGLSPLFSVMPATGCSGCLAVNPVTDRRRWLRLLKPQVSIDTHNEAVRTTTSTDRFKNASPCFTTHFAPRDFCVCFLKLFFQIQILQEILTAYNKTRGISCQFLPVNPRNEYSLQTQPDPDFAVLFSLLFKSRHLISLTFYLSTVALSLSSDCCWFDIWIIPNRK